jgi:mono/diheme cytochrome c family protein
VPRYPGFQTSPLPTGTKRRNDAQLTASVLEGNGTVMPAFSGKLGEAQVRELVAYLRSFVPQGLHRSHSAQLAENFGNQARTAGAFW